MQQTFRTMKLLLATLAVLLPSSSADFSPPAPIPFHAPQQFSFQGGQYNEGQAGGVPAIPSGFFLPPPPPPGDSRRQPAGLFPASTVQRPPLPLPSLPWEVPERSPSDPFAQREHFASLFAPRPHQQQPAPSKPQILAPRPPRPPPPSPQQQPPKNKLTKGGTVYPKKWIPAPADGKKIKPKNVEKHRQQLVVLSSTTNKELRGDEVQVEPEARVDEVLRINPRRQPKNRKYPAAPTYEPLPVEAHYSQPATPAPRTAEDYVAAEESQEVVQEPKPYAFNHQQVASGSGFAPLFAAESAGVEHGFIGQETAHPINSGSGDRVAFHIHGEKGPNSYRFGYDTGKGPDRQFRYEQRDDDGNVKGHFGFYDKHGKLQVAHYSADPKNGFSADGGNFGKHEVL